jgi:hypothetical protein
MEGTKNVGAKDIILSIDLLEVPGRGYSWRLRTADGETVRESRLLPSLQACLDDACRSSMLNADR